MTDSDIDAFCKQGSWRDLAQVAADLVGAAESMAGSLMCPLLGGGTRLMLACAHRISHDIDLFVRDPQWIGFLTPRLHEPPAFVTDYMESSNFIKFRLVQGEIDFIVAPSLYSLAPETSPLTTFQLDPIKEVIGKKLLYRGATMAARDLFDLWTVCREMPDVFSPADATALLGARLPVVRAQILNIANSRASSIAWDGLQKRDPVPLIKAAEWTIRWLDEAIRLHESSRPVPPPNTSASKIRPPR